MYAGVFGSELEGRLAILSLRTTKETPRDVDRLPVPNTVDRLRVSAPYLRERYGRKAGQADKHGDTCSSLSGSRREFVRSGAHKTEL